ncbi:MAG TPA: DUF4259 domain-containing protein [Haliscomenobacter sp.]|uniref:DUF4259 domain-containing protein n=1 Tax=Haliscomenobacter sp. TaxID=2717303 RepID=UPI002D0314E1|nr:DUF4259 domain-containing protein [Haliscomenobacter sp.]HOY18227.1 DUF4259 domain-containing protein [Haliscomenobacter sp.]
MGIWGITNFENDAAVEWVAEFSEKQSIDKIEGLFSDAVEDDEPDAELGASVLAAAELLAISQGNEPEEFDGGLLEDYEIDLESIHEWIDADLINLAINAVEKISQVEDSELRQVWEEEDELDHWLHVVEDLKKRVKG